MLTRSMVTRSRCRVVHVQISKADGRRAIEQQKQQKQQQNQQQKQQKQTGGGETRVSLLPLNPAGIVSTGGAEVCITDTHSLRASCISWISTHVPVLFAQDAPVAEPGKVAVTLSVMRRRRRQCVKRDAAAKAAKAKEGRLLVEAAAEAETANAKATQYLKTNTTRPARQDLEGAARHSMYTNT